MPKPPCIYPLDFFLQPSQFPLNFHFITSYQSMAVTVMCWVWVNCRRFWFFKSVQHCEQWVSAPQYTRRVLIKTNFGISGCTMCNFRWTTGNDFNIRYLQHWPKWWFCSQSPLEPPEGHFGCYNLCGEQVSLAPQGCIVFCHAQPQLQPQLQLWLRLVLFFNSSSHPPWPKKYFNTIYTLPITAISI